MEMHCLEKVLYYDKIRFLHYRLEYPEGEAPFFAFAKDMTEGYCAYLEGDFFRQLCEEYDADPERRKRYRHTVVDVTQRVRLFCGAGMLSFLFDVCENGKKGQFGFTFDTRRGVLMNLSDFGVKKRGAKACRLLFCDGRSLYVFEKDGTLLEKREVTPCEG